MMRIQIHNSEKVPWQIALAQNTVLGIRIRMILGLPDPDPLVRGTDPDPDPSIFLLNVLSGLPAK
jgi:hypothetical protein